MRTAFKGLGLTDTEVAELEGYGLPMDQVVALYEEGQRQLAASQAGGVAGAVGASAVAGGPGAATGVSGATDAAAGVPGTVADPTGLGLNPAPTGPPAWNEAWRRKFIDAGIPAEIVQQMSLSGANGMDARQLQQSLTQLKVAIQQSKAQLEQHFSTVFPEVEKMFDYPDVVKNLDEQSLAMVALSVQDWQHPAPPEVQQQVMQLVQTPQNMLTKVGLSMHPNLVALGMQASGGTSFTKSMIFSQLGFFFIPGYGLIRYAMGRDPLSGQKVDRSSKMEMFFAATGAISAFIAARSLYSVHNAFQMIARGEQTVAQGGSSLVHDVAVTQGVDNLTFFDKLKAYVPFTRQNKALTGIPIAGQVDRLLALPEGSLGRSIGEVEAEALRAGSMRITAPTAGILWKPNTMGFGMRGTVLYRNASLSRWQIGWDAAAELQYSPLMYGSKGAAAHLAADGTQLLDPVMLGKLGIGDEQIASVLAQHLKGIQNPMQAVRYIALGKVADELGLRYSGTLSRLYNALRPGPFADAVKAAGNVQPSKVVNWWNTAKWWQKYLPLGAVGGGGYFLYMKRQAQAAADAAQAEAQGQGGAQTPGVGGAGATGDAAGGSAPADSTVPEGALPDVGAADVATAPAPAAA